jgi:hypothetical protein
MWTIVHSLAIVAYLDGAAIGAVLFRTSFRNRPRAIPTLKVLQIMLKRMMMPIT